jgi:hypothetical protein
MEKLILSSAASCFIVIVLFSNTSIKISDFAFRWQVHDYIYKSRTHDYTILRVRIPAKQSSDLCVLEKLLSDFTG